MFEEIGWDAKANVRSSVSNSFGKSLIVNIEDACMGPVFTEKFVIVIEMDRVQQVVRQLVTLMERHEGTAD